MKKYEINEELAKRAKSAYSFSDYVENSATNSYYELLSTFDNAVNELIKKNSKKPYPATPEQMELVEYYKDKYAMKLAYLINRDNEITASCPSVLIAGFSNFPVQKKERQNAAHDKLYKEYGELYQPTNNYYFHKIEIILTNNTIYSNDDLAIEKLENKLQDREELQAKMKAYNAYYRKNHTMKGFEGISDETAEKMDKDIEESYIKQPCASFELQNNNAEIRRIKKRIEELKSFKQQAEKPVENKYPHVDGVKVVENSAAMRIQLIFDGKPEERTRDILKENGFKWSPKFGAWQRQLNNNGISAVKRVLKTLSI